MSLTILTKSQPATNINEIINLHKTKMLDQDTSHFVDQKRNLETDMTGMSHYIQ